jgi:hypothetical protein
VKTLKTLGLREALAEANRHVGGGKARLEALSQIYAPSGQLELVELATADEFLDLAWQEIDATRALTPSDAARTLRAVAERVLRDPGSFAAIAEADPRAGLDPSWFGPCAAIEREGFDWSKWQSPWLVPAVESEWRFCPATTLYVFEGVHSTAVLAVELLRRSVDWRPITAVLCRGRP